MSAARDLAAVDRISPAGLVIRSWRDDSTRLVALYGELDLASGPLLEQHLRRPGSPSPERLVIDLSGLEFLDCSGLHALLRVRERCQASGEMLSLLHGPPSVDRIFDLTGTRDLFAFGDDEPTFDGDRHPRPSAAL